MNEEIKKFWNNLGYNIIRRDIRNYVYFIVSKKSYVEKFSNKVALIPGDREIEYFFLNSDIPYTEKEMTQLIRLRAFL